MPRTETCIICHGRMNGPIFYKVQKKQGGKLVEIDQYAATVEIYECPEGHANAGITSEA